MKTIVIMQPNYIPWLGYFDLMDCSDVFVFLDNVQIVRKTATAFACRNRIKTNQGELFLVCPIKKGEQKVNEILYNHTLLDDNQNWRSKHLRSLEMSYQKAPHFEEVLHFITPLVQNGNTVVADFNIEINQEIARKIGITTEFKRASQLANISGEKDTRLVTICRAMGGTHYLSPKGAHEYIELQNTSGAFANTELGLLYQNYLPTEYPQLFGNFIPYMSILDLLFNVGFTDALKVIRNGRQPFLSSHDFIQKLNS